MVLTSMNVMIAKKHGNTMRKRWSQLAYLHGMTQKKMW